MMNSQLQYSHIYKSNSDRKLKSHVSQYAKFFPDTSSQWKVLEEDVNFKVFRRDIKKKIIKGWNANKSESEDRALEYFIIIKKALSTSAVDILKEECQDNPIEKFTTY